MKFPNQRGPTILGALTIQKALSLIKGRKKSHAIMKSDYLVVISAITTGSNMKSISGLVIYDC